MWLNLHSRRNRESEWSSSGKWLPWVGVGLVERGKDLGKAQSLPIRLGDTKTAGNGWGFMRWMGLEAMR